MTTRPRPQTFSWMLGALLVSAACTPSATEEPGLPATEPNAVVLPNEPNRQPAVQPNETTGVDPVIPNTNPQNNNEVVIPVTPAPTLRVVGRSLPDDGNGPILSWPHSQIVAGFSGTSLKATLTELTVHFYGNVGRVNNHFNVSIDGGAPVHLPALRDGTQTVTLATGLAPGNHVMVLTKRTEGQIGSTQLRGFIFDSGASLQPGTQPSARRIEFIGDSGTVGYGADGNDIAGDVCTFTAATENAAGSYAALTAKALAAEVQITGNSGKGIYQNRDPVNDNINTLPEMFTWAGADPALDTGRWDYARWQPQAVVAIVGGNDFAANTPSASAYAAAANRFIKTLRTAYPNAWIFVGVSPMLSKDINAGRTESTDTVGRRYAQAMVTAAADAKVAYIDVPLDDGSRRYGCDYHLSPASNVFYANIFARAIGTRLGWSPTAL